MNIIPSILAAFQRRKRARLDARLLLQLLAVMSGIVLIFAVLFILRGLNFDVPTGLQFWNDMQNAPMCN